MLHNFQYNTIFTIELLNFCQNLIKYKCENVMYILPNSVMHKSIIMIVSSRIFHKSLENKNILSIYVYF